MRKLRRKEGWKVKEMVKMEDEKTASLIEQLKQFDNNESYRLPHEEINATIKPLMNEIIEQKDKYMDSIYKLLENEVNLSSGWALDILEIIKDEKSVPYLIEFIIKNDDGSCPLFCEEAMEILQSIGKPAVEPLLKEIKKSFSKKEYPTILVSSLIGIKDDKVFAFMKEIVEDQSNNSDDYKGWFNIKGFISYFHVQEGKESIVLLEEIIAKKMNKIDKMKKRNAKNKKKIELLRAKKARYELERRKLIDEKNMVSKKSRKPGRNEPCPCGSGKKYKKCCLDRDAEEIHNPELD